MWGADFAGSAETAERDTNDVKREEKSIKKTRGRRKEEKLY